MTVCGKCTSKVAVLGWGQRGTVETKRSDSSSGRFDGLRSIQTHSKLCTVAANRVTNGRVMEVVSKTFDFSRT